MKRHLAEGHAEYRITAVFNIDLERIIDPLCNSRRAFDENHTCPSNVSDDIFSEFGLCFPNLRSVSDKQ